MNKLNYYLHKDSKTGEYKSFTGNMSALLIAEYILSQKKEKQIILCLCFTPLNLCPEEARPSEMKIPLK